MRTGADQLRRCAMVHVVQSHRWQTGPREERLEVLREPRPVDGVPVLGREEKRIVDGHDGALGVPGCRALV